MRKFITSLAVVFLIVGNSHCDTVPGRFERQKIEYRTDLSEIRPDVEPLIETPQYNQTFVITGFLGVILSVGGFAYLLTKKKY